MATHKPTLSNDVHSERSRWRTSDILGVRVACVDKSALLATVRGWIAGEGRHIITYVNAYCLNVASRDRDYHHVLNEADLVYADGVGAVWASKVLGGCGLHKMTGADWIYDYARLAEQSRWSTYILAGRPGIANAAAENLRMQFPGLEIVGACDGYFEEKPERQVLAEIERLCPDVVFVGRGTPRQEKWIARHRSHLSGKIAWAVGALFDYVAGQEPRAPEWMRMLPLEWLWRLTVDPKGKWKRYVLGNPLFMLRVLRQKLT